MKPFSDNLLYIFIFLAGFVFCLISFNLVQIQIDYQVSISDILSLIVTSIVGIYLGKQIQERHLANRFEKEYLMGEIVKLTQYMDTKHCFKNFNHVNFDEIKAAFKEINIMLTNLEMTVQDSNYSNTISVREVRQKFSTLRRQVLNISPINDYIVPQQSQVILINKEYKEFRRQLFRLITAIN